MLRHFKNLYAKLFQKNISTSQKASHLKTGCEGEKKALKYLRKKGFRVLEKNWRAHPHEIDLICKDDDEIVFVEVKARKSANLEDALNAFHEKKQDNLVRAAQKYLILNDLWEVPCRFDLICIYNENKNLEHYTNVIEYQYTGETRGRYASHRGNSSW